MLAPAGTLVDGLESKLTASPALGAAGVTVNCTPFAGGGGGGGGGALAGATVTAFAPVVDQETATELPVALPATVPPLTFQVHPLLLAVQLLANPEKV